MSFYQWNCKEHGFYKYEEEYPDEVAGCPDCFKALRADRDKWKKLQRETNIERAHFRWENEELREIAGAHLVSLAIKNIKKSS